MTLTTWGPNRDQQPLEIAILDTMGLSCLSIAILQGHLALAEAIVQINRVQYIPPTSQARRFEIDSDAEDSDDDDGLNIISHIVDENFTHDNIGEISSKVQSRTPPVQILEFPCKAHLFIEGDASSNFEFFSHDSRSGAGKITTLFDYAIFKNDVPLLEFLLKLREDCIKIDHVPGNRERAFLELAMALGRTECLAKIIQVCGAGCPIDYIAEQYPATAEETEKPSEYPGLSIRGKKRKDWASGGQPVRHAKAQPSPLLVSAMQGNLAVTEWFLGTAPGRHYLDYLSSHADDKRVRRIAKSKFGLEGSVLNWLQTRSEYHDSLGLLIASSIHYSAIIMEKKLMNHVR